MIDGHPAVDIALVRGLAERSVDSAGKMSASTWRHVAREGSRMAGLRCAEVVIVWGV
jgi:hypothetical protein